MSDWQLGIDFGTTATVVAVASGGHAGVIDVESNGQSRLPSAVYVNDDGEVLVGTMALQQSVFHPERFEPTPKRSIGEGQIFLGDDLVEVSDLIAGVFRRVYREACRQQGGTAPSAVRVTHPAGWRDKRLALLQRAVAAAGIEHAEYVAEPIAAAARIAMATTEPGQSIAVYDFGGGTFDAAVLRRSTDAFEVAGPPTGRDPLGGEDIDKRVFDYLGSQLSADHPDEWKRLSLPDDVVWRRHVAGLRREIRLAKETLSEATSCQLWVPGIETGVQLTRSEFEDLVRKDVDATVEALAEAIAAADTEASALAGVYLVGGSSRIPLVADSIWRTLGVIPKAQENPKSVVAVGAATWDTNGQRSSVAPTQTESADVAGPAVTSVASPSDVAQPVAGAATAAARPARRSTMRLALMTGGGTTGQAGPPVRCSATFTVQHPGAGEVSVHVWAAPPGATTAAFADNVARQYAADRSYRQVSFEARPVLGQGDGLLRRYTASSALGPEDRVDAYAMVGGYSVVAVAPRHLAGDLDELRVSLPRLDPATFFAPNLEYVGDATATVHERVQLNVVGTTQQVTAERVPTSSAVGPWLDWRVDGFARATPGTAVLARSAGRVLGDIPGEVVTLRVPGQPPRVVAVGAGASGDGLYEVTVWVAEHERSVLPWLAYRPLIQPLP